MKKLLIVLSIFALSSCSPRLTIVHVNDTHSHLEPVHSGEYDGLGGAIERGAIVDSIRARHGEGNVLLLHAGDFNQGSAYFSVLGGSAEVSIVNAFKYDCLTLGNHEFDNGIDDLASRLARINSPVACCNINASGLSLEPYIKPYVILRRAGRKIGIVGVTANLTTVVAAETFKALRQVDPVPEINKWASYLKNEEKCDMIILLSHQGFMEDKENAPGLHNIDIIVGGHSHTYLDSICWVKDADGKPLPIVQDGCWGLEVGEITVR